MTVVAFAAGCASSNGYQKAFSADSAIKGNHQEFQAPLDQTFRAAKITLVRQGFTIEQADLASGVIKAVRNLQDPSDANVSYNIITTADVTSDADSSIVTLAASQQTVLHREWHDWWHLLWIIPLFPTGTEYQTVVTQEGNVTDPAFYKDFFTSVTSQIATAAASRRPVVKPEPALEVPPAIVAPATTPDQSATPADAAVVSPAAAPVSDAAPAAVSAPIPADVPVPASVDAPAAVDTTPAVPATTPVAPAVVPAGTAP